MLNKGSNSIDLQAKSQFFELGFVLGDRTFYENIKSLEPGTAIEVHGSLHGYSRWGLFEKDSDDQKDLDCLAFQINESIRASVSKFTGRYTDFYSTLTGGLDSRLIAGVLSSSDENKPRFLTFSTVGLPLYLDEDVRIAQMVSDKLGGRLYTEPFVEFDTPFSWQYFERSRANRGIPALSGMYGEFIQGKFGSVFGSTVEAFLRGENISQNVCGSSVLRGLGDSASDGLSPFDDLNSFLSRYRESNSSMLSRMILMTNSFFTHAYSGTRGLWDRPYMQLLRVFTPFLSPEFMRLILEVPTEILFNPKQPLYNTLYLNHHPNLTSIPSNSTLSSYPENCIVQYTEGINSFPYRKLQYQHASQIILGSEQVKSTYKSLSELPLDHFPADQLNKLVDYEAFMMYLDSLG
ncbi:MAG: hypothetical protein H6601_07880 [Flavobacteriales bacterium]|nr:hypothetical protein [Flavobacteriales bacterium]MCB9205118.1 hypothetical protein [Flavobacteriales bacterium]